MCLVYIVNSRTAKTTKRDPFSKFIYVKTKQKLQTTFTRFLKCWYWLYTSLLTLNWLLHALVMLAFFRPGGYLSYVSSLAVFNWVVWCLISPKHWGLITKTKEGRKVPRRDGEEAPNHLWLRILAEGEVWWQLACKHTVTYSPSSLLCMWCACILVDIGVQCWCPITLHLTFLRQALFEPRTHCLFCWTDHPTSYSHIWLLHRYWGSKPRSSCLYSSCPLSHFSNQSISCALIQGYVSVNKGLFISEL